MKVLPSEFDEYFRSVQTVEQNGPWSLPWGCSSGGVGSVVVGVIAFAGSGRGTSRSSARRRTDDEGKPVAVHGTTMGLSRMQRQHVHFAPGLPGTER